MDARGGRRPLQQLPEDRKERSEGRGKERREEEYRQGGPAVAEGKRERRCPQQQQITGEKKGRSKGTNKWCM